MISPSNRAIPYLVAINRSSSAMPCGLRADELTPSIYLDTEAEVETYVASLKAELLDTIRSGKQARIS